MYKNDEERKHVKEKLDAELHHLTFTAQKDVLSRLRQKSWREKFHDLWNKEIEIPIMSLAAAFTIVFFMIGVVGKNSSVEHTEYKQLTSVGDYFYWQSELEKLVNNDENKN